MGDKAPEKYTPEYCTVVHERMKEAVEAAVNALSAANQSQRDLTSQAVKHLQSAFEEVKEENERQNKRITDLKIQFYAAGITGLVFLMGFVFSIFKMVKG